LHHAESLRTAVEREAWDGAWYRRAYFDDGTPLGTASAAECRIDSLAQSWGAISAAGDPARVSRAMRAVDDYLVRRGDDMILLFTPPSIARRWIPATSRATCRACARTAASTRTPRSGARWPGRPWARAIARARSSTCSTRSTMPPRARACTPTR